MVTVGSGAEREITDYHLSRYACYLIVINGDARKKVIRKLNEMSAKAQIAVWISKRLEVLTVKEHVSSP